MRIMVIGAKGQVGSEICALARLREHEVIEAGRRTPVLTEVTNQHQIRNAFRDHECINAVFNCAAEHRIAECERAPERAYLVNSFPQALLAQECEKAGASFVYLSTDYVFPARVKHSEPRSTVFPQGYSPWDPSRPESIYGLTKQLGEMMTLKYKDGYVARLSHVYGHSPCKSKGPNMVDRMVASLRTEGVIRVKDLEGDISMTYAKDAARMLLRLVELRPGIYHCVNEGSTTPLLLAREIGSLQDGPEPKITEVQLEPEDREVPRPVDANLLPSAEFKGLNRPIFAALREYLADCGHCTPY